MIRTPPDRPLNAPCAPVGRTGLDRAGLVLSGLCAVHCLAGLALVGMLGLGGGLLLNPAIHRIGLAAAVVIGALTLGLAALRHARIALLGLGLAGIALMALALGTGHGTAEATLTIAGVALLGTAHWRNLRAA